MRTSLRGLACTLISALVLVGSGRADDRHPFPLHNARADVAVTYETLRVMPRGEAKVSFSQLPPAMKADVWTIHLERFLEAHPNLLEEQREVVFEGLGLLASGLPAQLANTKDNHDTDYAMLRTFSRRVSGAFPVDLAAEAFINLGPELTVPIATPLPVIGKGRLHAAPYIGNAPPCQCSSDSDWCNGVTNPDNKCNNPKCTPVDGCGTFWLFWCDNLCGPDPPLP